MNYDSPEKHLDHLVYLLNEEAKSLNKRFAQANAIAEKLGKKIEADEETGLLQIKDIEEKPKIYKA